MPLNSLFALAQPYIVKLTIDLFLAHRNVAPPRWLAPAASRASARSWTVRDGRVYLVLVLGEFATFYGQFYLTMMVAQYSLSDLRLALFQHVEQLPMAFFDRTPIGQAGQPHQHRHRCDQRDVRRRLADHFYRLPDAGRHRRHHVHAQSAPRAVGVSVDSAAVSDHQLLPRPRAGGLSRDSRSPRRGQCLPLRVDQRDGGDPALHARGRERQRVRRAQHQKPRRPDARQRL